MATRILHLTDLHLEQPGDYVGTNAKSHAVPSGHLPSRTAAIKNTTAALAASDRIEPFDVLVLTGDVPWRNAEEGWSRLEEVLEPLKTAGKLPQPDHIVVTPGNHDVQWRLDIDDPDHYSLFLRYVRDAGYITPLLDRFEVDEKGSLLTSAPERHYLFDPLLGVAVVPINSSHYCGIYEPLGVLKPADLDELESRISAELLAKVQQELAEQRLFDIPRVSPQQLTALSQLIIAHLETAVVAAGSD